MNETIDNNNEVTQQKEQTTQNKKAGKKILFFIIALITLAILYTFYWFIFVAQYESTENAYVSAHQNLVTSQIAGNITEIGIEDTQPVQKGKVAIKIESLDYKLALSRAQNDLARAVRSVKSLQINENQSEENLSLKQSDLSKAKEDFNRDKKAFEAGVLSQEQLDNTKHKLDQASLATDSARTSLKNSKVQAVSKSIQEHPEVAKAINQYKQTAIDLKRTEITVPTNGVIARKAVYIGQRVSPNQQLFSVIDVDDEWVDANFKESQLKVLKIGQEVELYSDVNDKTYKGYISGIGAGSGSSLSLLPAQNATGNWIKIVQRVPVRINITQESLKENGVLPVGTSISAKVNTKKTMDVQSAKIQKSEFIYDEASTNKEIAQIIKDNMRENVSGVK